MQKIKVNILGLFMVLFITIVGIMTLTSDASGSMGILFLVFQICIMIIPGIAIIYILKIPIQSKLELISLAYGVGFALNIINYYITVPFGIKEMIGVVELIELVLSLYLLYKNRKTWGMLKEDCSGNIICVVLILIYFSLRYFTYYGINKLPDTGEYNFFTADLLYYIGNAIELSNQYPPMDFRWYQQPYNYHFFGSIQLAVLQMFVKSPMAILEYTYGFLQSIFLLITAGYCVVKRIVKYPVEIIITLVMILFVTGIEMWTMGTYMNHMLIAPFGFDYGIAFALLSILFFQLYWKHKENQKAYLFLTLLFFGICMGCKAPVAIVLLTAMGIQCIYYFVGKKEYRKGFLMGAPLIILFIVIYFGVVSQGFSTINTNRGISFQPLSIVLNSSWGAMLYDNFGKNYGALGLGSVTCIYLLVAFPQLFILLFVYGSSKILKIKDNIDTLFFFSGIIMGTLLFLFTNQNGYSQLYFIFATLPICALLIGKKLSCIRDKNSKYGKFVIYITSTVVILLSVGSIFQYRGNLKQGMTNTLKGMEGSWYANQANLMTYEQYVAYQWIRNNTDKEDIIASNIMLQDYQGRSFVTGVFTERYLWLEGWEYGYITKDENQVKEQTEILKGAFLNQKECIALLKNQGVKYLIQIRQIAPEYTGINSSIVYENEEVIVYEL